MTDDDEMRLLLDIVKQGDRVLGRRLLNKEVAELRAVYEIEGLAGAGRYVSELRQNGLNLDNASDRSDYYAARLAGEGGPTGEDNQADD